MIKELRPEYEILEARNGKEALDTTEAESVKIIITDIKMPVMDGLDFIKALNGRGKNIKIIILSGFAYFEYAQAALRLGAFDFVLKPVNQVKVNDMLKKVEGKIEEEIREHKEKERIRKQLDNTLPAYLERQLNKWLDEGLNKDELKELAGVFPFMGKGTVIVSEIGKYDQSVKDLSIDELNEMKMSIKFWVKEAVDSLGHSITFFREGSPHIFITILNAAGDSDLSEQRLCGYLKDFADNIHTSYGFLVTIGVGSIYEDIFKHVHVCCNEAFTALGHKFFIGMKEVIAYTQIPHYKDTQFFIRYVEEDELLEAVRHLDRAKVAEKINCILDRIKTDEYPSPDIFKEMTVQIIQNLLKSLQNLIYERDYKMFVVDAMQNILGSETFQELRIEMLAALDNILVGIKACRGNRDARIIEKCKEYMETHYVEDLSLELIADMFKFNTSYFSVFFRNNTGVNFTEYLMKIRMKKAVGFLKGSSMKIYEIAKNTGYRNEKYFNRVFKKEFGISPDEYRRVNAGM